MCIFCSIIIGQIPAEIVYEDEDVIAILDVNPLTKDHTLVIPKAHYKNLFDTPPELVAKVALVAQRLAKDYQKKNEMAGFHLVVNNNSEAYQSVDHLHFHIIPRYNRDELAYFQKLYG